MKLYYRIFSWINLHFFLILCSIISNFILNSPSDSDEETMLGKPKKLSISENSQSSNMSNFQMQMRIDSLLKSWFSRHEWNHRKLILIEVSCCCRNMTAFGSPVHSHDQTWSISMLSKFSFPKSSATTTVVVECFELPLHFCQLQLSLLVLTRECVLFGETKWSIAMQGFQSRDQ